MGDLSGSGFRNRVSEAKNTGKGQVLIARIVKKSLEPLENNGPAVGQGLCDLTKINGVSEDAIKLRLFLMSLADKAHQWEKSLPHGTITTWDECKKPFLANFFSTGRTAKLRSEISSFIQ
ncbi:unnamed protein product [Microthlaspi erraticum]|uniref:Retrotransposon gag domain-containing protein n=1 Tax=Microthlaspi erraticum TaxID=1685480 RepID=A0A6D2IUD7_9BRAS|nr:unnamed protein product [Microthlaspi erraticum]